MKLLLQEIRELFRWTLVVAILLVCLWSRAATAIQIRTIPGQMKYETTLFEVHAGEALELTFTNNCIMPHNLVVTAMGKADSIVNAAMALGGRGLEMDFVPDSPDVLQHTKLIPPGQAETLSFSAPRVVGDYPYVCTFPGHGILMRGVMRVKTADQTLAGQVKEEVIENRVVDSFADVTYTNTPLGTPEKPVVIHTFMPNPGLEPEVFTHHHRGYPAGRYNPSTGQDQPGVVDTVSGLPAAIGVNFGEDFSYCWDTTECRLMYAWSGGFLDFEPYWGRGGGGSRRSFGYVPTLQGQTFYKAIGIHPFQNGETMPSPKYLGFRLDENIPVFTYRVGNRTIHEKITPRSGGGLRIDYAVEGGPDSLNLNFDMAVSMMIVNDKGEWKDHQLVLNGPDARQFGLEINAPRRRR